MKRGKRQGSEILAESPGERLEHQVVEVNLFSGGEIWILYGGSELV